MNIRGEIVYYYPFDDYKAIKNFNSIVMPYGEGWTGFMIVLDRNRNFRFLQRELLFPTRFRCFSGVLKEYEKIRPAPRGNGKKRSIYITIKIKRVKRRVFHATYQSHLYIQNRWVMNELLNVISASDKRRNLLILFSQRPEEWDDIKKILNVTSTGMLPQVKILEDEHLIERDGRKFFLTPMGKVLTTHMEPLIRTLEVFDKNSKFWQDHNIGVLPQEILLHISELGNYQIIENSDEEIFDVSTFLKNISPAKTLKGLAHTVHPTWPGFFMSLAKKGVKTSLIFTPGVLKIMDDKYPGWVGEFLGLGTTSLYVTKNDFKFSYVVTDSYFSISLFYNTGFFDSKNDVTSHDPSAIRWGERIYLYLLEHSKKVEHPD